MNYLVDQIDQMINTARIQAQEYRSDAAYEPDPLRAQRLLGVAEALCGLANEAAAAPSNEHNEQTRRKLLTKLMIHTSAAAGALDERPAQERAMKIAN